MTQIVKLQAIIWVVIFAILVPWATTEAQEEEAYTLVTTIEHPAQGDFHSAEWDESGELLSAGGTGGIWLYGQHFQVIQQLPLPETTQVQKTDWHPLLSQLAFATSGDRSSDFLVGIWKIDENEVVYLEDGYGEITRIAWSPDGSRLAIGWDGGIEIIDATTFAVVAASQALPEREIIFDLAWNPTGNEIASVSEDSKVRIRDSDTAIASDEALYHDALFYSVAWSQVSKLAIGSLDQDTVLIFDATSGYTLEQRLTSGDRHDFLAWTLDGTQLLTDAGTEGIFIWSYQDNTLIQTGVISDSNPFKAASWNAANDQIVTVGLDYTIRVWQGMANAQE